MSRLYLVPTPIGNLEDITLRAARVLKEVDFILAEDTRTSAVLLRHLGIEKRMLAHHKFNEHGSAAAVARTLATSEQTAALISDAGSPAISDPGFLVVRECLVLGVEVEALPGPTAFVPALTVSGLPSERFCFEGFLPQKKGRNTALQALTEETRTMIFYESPFRVVRMLTDLAAVFGQDRAASASRELTKKFEQTVRGTLAELIEHFTVHPPKGEFVLVVAGKPKK